MIVTSSAAILAHVNPRDAHHQTVHARLESEERPLVTTPVVIAEVDHLVCVGRSWPMSVSASQSR
jgi:predicted nucleic acid-binding protein